MTRLPLFGRAYVSSVVAIGAAVLFMAVMSAHFPRPGLLVVLLLLSVVTSAMKVDLPLGMGGSSISLSYAVDFTALLLLGPAPAMLMAVPSVLTQCALCLSHRNPPYKTVFSTASVVLSIAAAAATYSWLGGEYGTLPDAPLQPLMAAAMAYFAVNSVAIATAVALATGRPVFNVWHDHFLWSISSYVVGAIAAGIVVELFQITGQWHATLAFIPLALAYRTYRLYLKRVADSSQLHRDSTEVLARAIQAKDDGGSCHVERVQYYAAALARQLNLPEAEREAVQSAALLHDIGKLAVPEHILSKPGPLTADERRRMQVHADIGAEIVSAVRFPSPVAPLIRSHHERWDGSGYPAGLRGTHIPLGARILAVVDAFDAVTSSRPYRPAATPHEAIEILQREAGKAFDPDIVAHFIALLPALTPPTDDAASSRHLTPFCDTAAYRPPIGDGQRSHADAFAKIASANRETYTLYEIAQSLGRSMSLADTMTLVSAKLSMLVPFSSCALFVRSGEGDLQCRFATGDYADLLENASLGAGCGLSGWVMHHRRPLVNGLPDIEFNAAGILTGNLDLRSALVCPLVAGGDVIGTIAVFHKDAQSYTEDHRRVLDQVSNQAAAVVHNALVFERTHEQAFKDGLTGLANPRALQFQVTRELARARRAGAHFSLVLFDLDDFKMINDEHGHVTGDRALQEVARVLQATSRPYDTCIRYGGDEFVVLLPSCTRAEAEDSRRRLQEAVAAISLRAEDGQAVKLRVSAGASVFPEDGESYERLLARADRRMYRNKAQAKASPMPLRAFELCSAQ